MVACLEEAAKAAKKAHLKAKTEVKKEAELRRRLVNMLKKNHDYGTRKS